MPRVHEHRFKVTKDSVFGFYSVNAILQCCEKVIQKDGSLGKCGAKLPTRILKYQECEEVTSLRTGIKTFYWREPKP